MNREAGLLIEIKSVSDDQRVITGVATSPTVDRMGDIVDPLGATFQAEIPLLLNHDPEKLVGTVRLAKPTKAGIDFTARLPKIAEEGALKEMVDMAWQMVKYHLLRDVSIGFRPIGDAVKRLSDGGLHFLRTEILELSLVPIPAQIDAQIVAFKQLKSFAAKQQLAAPGRTTATQRGGSPARAGAVANPSTPPKGTTVKTYTQDALAALQEQRETKAKRMAELRELKSAESRAFSPDERSEFDGLDREIEDLDDEIRVTERHVGNIAKAKPLESGRGGMSFARNFKDVEPRFKGEEGLKRVMCQLQSALDIKTGKGLRSAAQIAEMRYGKTNPTLVAVMKAGEVAGAGSGSGEALAELVAVDNRFTGDFVDYLYGTTVYDRLPLREVPANVAIKGMDGAYTGYFVGESKPIPMSQGSASSNSTSPLKVAALTVLSNELIRDSSPAALGIAGDGLRQAIAQVVDTKFFSVDAASAGVSPAGILNGVSIGATAGADEPSVIIDVKALFALFDTAKIRTGFVWVMTPALARALMLMRNALGQASFQGPTPEGGTFMGYPVYVGDNIGTGDAILMAPREVWKVGDTGVSVSISNETMIEQSSAPTGETDTPVAASQAFTSMFQEESTAIKVVRSINWGKRRAAAVAYVGDAAWGS